MLTLKCEMGEKGKKEKIETKFKKKMKGRDPL
jgi:hypothetical protein